MCVCNSRSVLKLKSDIETIRIELQYRYSNLGTDRVFLYQTGSYKVIIFTWNFNRQFNSNRLQSNVRAHSQLCTYFGVFVRAFRSTRTRFEVWAHMCHVATMQPPFCHLAAIRTLVLLTLSARTRAHTHTSVLNPVQRTLTHTPPSPKVKIGRAHV